MYNSADGHSINLLVGSDLFDSDTRPLSPFSIESISFLSELSRQLLASAEARNYPDIVTFAYWCRRANLSQLSKIHESGYHRVGRGIVFHVTPSNVPVNFAFSLAFGMLAGNSNIVRVSNNNYPQIFIICDAINKIFRMKEYSKLSAMTRVIRYPYQDEITSKLSNICHARMLWGGDATIAYLKSFVTSPRCVDICFSDRLSLSILNADAIIMAGEYEFNNLILAFYNDAFSLYQNACSSPSLVLWQGSDISISKAKHKFWHALGVYISKKSQHVPMHLIEKFNHLCRVAIELEELIVGVNHEWGIFRVELSNLPREIEKWRGLYGFFFEMTDNDLGGLESVVSPRYQTITYYGVDGDAIVQRIIAAGLMGVDRVVEVGRALDIGVVWDGHDLISALSRIISNK